MFLSFEMSGNSRYLIVFNFDELGCETPNFTTQKYLNWIRDIAVVSKITRLVQWSSTAFKTKSVEALIFYYWSLELNEFVREILTIPIRAFYVIENVFWNFSFWKVSAIVLVFQFLFLPFKLAKHIEFDILSFSIWNCCMYDPKSNPVSDRLKTTSLFRDSLWRQVGGIAHFSLRQASTLTPKLHIAAWSRA